MHNINSYKNNTVANNLPRAAAQWVKDGLYATSAKFLDGKNSINVHYSLHNHSSKDCINGRVDKVSAFEMVDTG